MLSINTGSIKEVVSLWLALCILMQVPHFVVPTGSKSRRLQRESTPACLPHCCQFNFECAFANQFLWLWWKSREGGGGSRAVKQQILLEGSQPAKKNCRWGRDRNSRVVELSLIVISRPPPHSVPSSSLSSHYKTSVHQWQALLLLLYWNFSLKRLL